MKKEYKILISLAVALFLFDAIAFSPAIVANFKDSSETTSENNLEGNTQNNIGEIDTERQELLDELNRITGGGPPQNQELALETEEEIIEEPEPDSIPTETQTIEIASWNLDEFDDAKTEDEDLMNIYIDIIDDFDIMFFQEITDTGTFDLLCNQIEDTECRISDKVGGEQYGVIFTDDFSINNLDNPISDSEDRWERPPMKVEFDIDGTEIIFYTMKVRPFEAQQELEYLEEYIEDKDNIDEDKIIIIGDLSADCSFYDQNEESEFDSDWFWITDNDEDTTSTSDDCAYDRIIANNLAEEDIQDNGVEEKDIDEDVSDHYLIWLEIEMEVN